MHDKVVRRWTLAAFAALLLVACGSQQQAAAPIAPSAVPSATAGTSGPASSATAAPAPAGTTSSGDASPAVPSATAGTSGPASSATAAPNATAEVAGTANASATDGSAGNGAGGAAATEAAAGAASAGKGEFSNPVIDRNFPDPDVLKVGDTYYAFATNEGGANVQLATSRDLVHWSMRADALPKLPAWARPGNTWAPEVTSAAQGYVLYFTARHAQSGRQCIGVATSAAPEGPFAPSGDQPLICQLDQGGSIDASSFADDDGSRYLLWKNDGNCCGQPTQIFIQKVSADGLSLDGQPTPVLGQDQPWEGRLIEAPTLWKHEGRYYLFYSANSYAGLDYAVGYASAGAILGPYQKGKGPLLASDLAHGAAFGPGGQDIVVSPHGATWILYHSWDPAVSYRRLQIDELDWGSGGPTVRGPDSGPQPMP